MKKHINLKWIYVMILSAFMLSCDDELRITMPKGPAGNDGLSAYEVWKQAVEDGVIEWNKAQTEVVDYFIFIKGEKGDSGENGKSAYELWVEQVHTGTLENPNAPGTYWDSSKDSQQDFWKYLSGADGKNGSVPEIGDNNNWWIDGKDTGVLAKGQDGQDGVDGQDGNTPEIGENGNWWIGDDDTGIPAKGQDGQDGNTPVVGENGNWWIADNDTGTPATGKSAYELWVNAVLSDEGLENPHDLGNNWPTDKTSLTDFWEYLRGEDSGDSGDSEGKDFVIVKDKYNVHAQYTQQDHNEFVITSGVHAGGVTYIVYDKEGNKVTDSSVSVTFPHIPAKMFTPDANGEIILSRDDLRTDENYTGKVTINLSGGGTEDSAPNTFVPTRIDVRIRVNQAPRLNDYGSYMTIPFVVERRLNPSVDEWQQIPDYLGSLTQNVYIFDTEYNAATGVQGATTHDNTSRMYDTWDGTGEPTMRFNISANQKLLMSRLVKSGNFFTQELLLWDDVDHYMALQLDSYYGMSPVSKGVVKMAPVQMMPYISDLTYGEAHTIDGYVELNKTKGIFNYAMVGGAPGIIDRSLIFKQAMVTPTLPDGADFYFEPKIEDEDFSKQQKVLVIRITQQFTEYQNQVKNSPFASEINSNFGFNGGAYVGATVELYCTNNYFKSFMIIGRIEKENNEDNEDNDDKYYVSNEWYSTFEKKWYESENRSKVYFTYQP